MVRVKRLLDLYPKMKDSNYRLVLVQIQEAHTKLWPLGMSDHPDAQKDFKERVSRANAFRDKYSIPYRIVVDPWGDLFEKKFRAWPDKYYMIAPDSDHTILAKSEYSLDALVKNDYGEMLERILG